MSSHRVQSFLIMLSLAAASQYVHGQQERESSTAPTWQETARKAGLSDADMAALEKNRILIANDAYKQIFSPYLASDKPVFITSDSLLNAYHVLFEESVLRLEAAMARRLPDILRLILKNLDGIDAGLKGKPELVSAARERAMLIPGIALRLLDDSFRFGNDKLDTVLNEEVARIIAARDKHMPKWLAASSPSFVALDYSRYQPRGFYTRSEQLQRYFRALSWLQSIPFRVSNDEELLAILMLGNTVGAGRFRDSDGYERCREIDLFFHAYRSFIGAGDDWDLMSAARALVNSVVTVQARPGGGGPAIENPMRMDLSAGDLQRQRDYFQNMAQKADGPLINDQIRFAPEDPTKAAEPNFRIISAYRTPDAILFQRTTRQLNRSYPDGLEVATLLGSRFARTAMTATDKQQLLATIDSCKSYLRGDSLYLVYLHAMEALLDSPEPDTPDFVKFDAWQAKSCNTVLGGWRN